ncbi:ribose 5-phosphate isomerase B [Entomoplasma freundtii]|uniref:Ribose-5-phosphate isomerase B n=1 Tax=Entomoplasma freundtii TaxID=74700 RepID=A0A2K8NU30_9MOLU|nr:RpiB/LacA/LacB family sugar-phosphate isomerase [Entomoplasma freundtii]ATZ16678.1 ribose-5-phosphate isomerase B [Entomoplasma freundtii]TDY58155.1 ribose 5-phosphate isomerase B [Entomoplasma freundtii]
MKKQKIYMANDHTAEKMKRAIMNHLQNKGYEVVDLSPLNDGQSCSYSEEGLRLGEAIAKDKDQGSLGIAICGTGVGISIAANKVKGVRCGLVYELETAALIKQHNNANVMATGARLIAIEKALLLVDTFLETNFEGGRHVERVATIDDYLG